ncbi:MAG: WbqC family protein, partial [Flavobacteriaceae bacterium]
MKNKVAILQSNYIPWKGYFDIIRSVDLFIFHDDLQYTKGDWRNRNKIKTPNGIKWLTIPCGTNEKRLICEVEITDHSWQKQHWNLIQMSYKKSEYFSVYKS